MVLAGLVVLAVLPPYDVSAAGLAVFVPMFSAVRHAARYTMAWVSALGVLGFYSLIYHGSSGHGLSLQSVAVFPMMLVIVVGAGMMMRIHAEQLAAQQRAAEERLNKLRLDLARELHDNAVHLITQAAMRANINALKPDTSQASAAEFRTIAGNCNTAAHELRLMLAGLRDESTASSPPDVHDPRGLAAAVDAQVDRLLAVNFTVNHNVDVTTLHSLGCRTLAAITTEAVNNIINHAKPRGTCEISITQHGPEIVARYVNEKNEGRRRSGRRNAFGIRGIEERANSAGGTMLIEDSRNSWRMIIRIPADAALPSQPMHEPIPPVRRSRPEPTVQPSPALSVDH